MIILYLFKIRSQISRTAPKPPLRESTRSACAQHFLLGICHGHRAANQRKTRQVVDVIAHIHHLCRVDTVLRQIFLQRALYP